MGVLLQRVGGGQHEGRAEEQPLQFEPGVGAEVEGLRRMALTVETRMAARNHPLHMTANEGREGIGEPAQGQQGIDHMGVLSGG